MVRDLCGARLRASHRNMVRLYRAGTGAASFNPYDYLETQVGRTLDRNEIRAAKRKRFAELVEAECALLGVTEYLTEAKRLGLKLAVASSSERAWVEGHLSRLGLLDYFDGLRCADDVTRTKPDPELYLSALQMLGVSAEAAVAIEDSPNGAGRQSGRLILRRRAQSAYLHASTGSCRPAAFLTRRNAASGASAHVGEMRSVRSLPGSASR